MRVCEIVYPVSVCWCVQVVCPGRSLELTTQLGMAKLRAELEVAAAANVSDAEKEDVRGRLRSAK